MKKLVLLFSMLVIGMSGCAYPGYQRTYVGYSTGYSSGYGGYRYYDYPARSYYQPGGVIRYQRYPAYPVPSYHHDDDHHKRRDWDKPGRLDRHESWKPYVPQKSWQDRSNRPDPSWSLEARKRLSPIESRRFQGFERRLGDDRREGLNPPQRQIERGFGFQRGGGRDHEHHHRD